METKKLLKSLKQRLSWLIMLTVLLCTIQDVWAEMWIFDNGAYDIKLNKNGTSEWKFGDNASRETTDNQYLDYSGETLTTLQIDEVWIKANANDNWGHQCAQMYYRISQDHSGDFTQLYTVKAGSEQKGQYTYSKNNVSFDILSESSGMYSVIYFDYYFAIGGNDCAAYRKGPESAPSKYYSIKFSNHSTPKDILDGSKIMFYIGEQTSWGQKTFYLSKNSSVVSTAPMVVEHDSKRYGVAIAPATTGYNVTHDKSLSYAGHPISGTPVQGGAYYNTDDANCQVTNSTALTASVTLASSSISLGSNVAISSSSKSDGILGLTSQIKYYATADNTTFTELSVSDNNLQTSGLTEGTWTIIPVFYDGHIICKGTTTTLTITPACTDPVAGNFTYTSSADYTGSGISANVAWKSGTGSGAITTYYEGTSYPKSDTPPTNVGNYNISINVAAGGSYCGKNDLSLGTMTINKINQSTLSITTSTEARCVSESPLTLETSGGSGSGAITYKIISGGTGTGSISGSKLTVTKSGTIKVQAEKAADTNYNKATSAIVTFTFNGTVVTTSPALDNIHPYEVVTLTADKESVTWDIADVPAGVVKDKNAYFPWGNTGKSVTFKGALGNGYHLTATADGCVTNIEFNVILDSEDCH